MFDAVPGTVEPGDIFDNKEGNNYYFCNPDDFAGELRDRVGIDNEEEAGQYIDEYDRDIDKFSRDSFAIDQEEPYCFSQAAGIIFVIFSRHGQVRYYMIS